MTGPDATPARGPLDPRVLGLSRALRTHLGVCAVVAIVVAAAVLVQAEAIAELLPRLIDGDGSAAWPLVGWLGLVAATRLASAATTDWSSTLTLIRTRTSIRRRVLDRSLRLPADARHEVGPAEVAALTTGSSDALEPWVRSYLPGLALAAVVPLAAGLRILTEDLASAVVLIVVVPLIPIFMVLIGWATEAQAARQWQALVRLSNRFLDVISGLPTLRLFGRADAQVDRVREVTERYRAATAKTLRVAFLSALVLEVMAMLAVAIIAVGLGIRLTDGSLTLQTALVVLLLAPECLLPIRRVAAAFHAATAGLDAAVEVDRVLDLPVRAEGERPLPERFELEAAGVAATDAERGVRLRPVDLRVAPGEVVAVGGPSGAGKSTLLDALRGALAPSAGTVTLGGVPVDELRGDDLAGAVAWVPQRPRAIGATVAESVAFGGLDADGVADVLARLGLTAIAELDPLAASGGERRRVALARAVASVEAGRAKVVLLDEPTAQLDAASSALVLDAIARLAADGAGVVVATHDPAVLAAADRVADVEPSVGDGVAHHPAAAWVPHVDAAPVPDPVPGWAPTVEPATAEAAGALRWVFGVARAQRRRLVAASLLGVATEACAVALAATAAWLIVRASEQPSFADLAVAAVGVRAFAVGKGVLRYLERLTSHDATLRLLADLRATVVARLARLAPTGLDVGRRGDVLTRLVDDIDRLQDLFLRVLGPLVAVGVVGVGSAILAAVLDPAAGVALLVAVVLVGGVLPAAAFAVARQRGQATVSRRGELSDAVVELTDLGDELVACGAAGRWRTRVEDVAGELDGLERRQGRASAAIAGLAAAAPAAATALVVAVTGPAGGGLSGPALGVLVLVPFAVMDLASPLAAAGEALARVEASASRVVALVRRPDPVPRPAAPAPRPAEADLALAGATIGWPDGPDQVRGLDLAVAEGERVALIGPSGAGKSTVAAALVGFLPLRAGRYDVGGTPAAELGDDAVRELVTWCQQDPWFADSTLADNLRIARPSATDDELVDALQTVHLGPWLSSLPRGLQTRLERDASTMSGGERQRLALARALLGGQRAIVLDEPTAHLDEATASAVLDDLLAATAQRAVVVIGHDEPGFAAGNVVRLGQPSGATREPAPK